MSERDLTGYVLESPHGNHYRARFPIAFGNHAMVYAGVRLNPDGAPGEDCALKVYGSELEHVEYEARHLQMLKGRSNIVQMIEWAESMQAKKDTEECNERVLVTTLADCSLWTLTEEENLPLDLTLKLLGDAAVGLAGVHGAGILHGDIKQQNLFVTDSPWGMKVELGDFGTAVSEKIQAPEPLISALSHAAPETLADWNASRSSDIYALAVVAYELLSDGFLPFEPPQQTIEEAQMRSPQMQQWQKWRLLHQSSDREVKPFLVDDAVHNNLYRVFRRALAVNIADRFPTALDLQEALMDAYCRGMEQMPKVVE